MAHSVNISHGPLSYTYTVQYIKIHFGGNDGFGTEHMFSGSQFDAEVSKMHVAVPNL